MIPANFRLIRFVSPLSSRIVKWEAITYPMSPTGPAGAGVVLAIKPAFGKTATTLLSIILRAVPTDSYCSRD